MGTDKFTRTHTQMENQKVLSSPIHAVMFPWFAFGHISPFIQLSNKLSSNGVRISFLSAPSNIQRISSSLHPGPHIQIIPLEIPTIQGLPPSLQSTADITPAMAELLKIALDQMQPQIKSLLTNLKPHFVFFDFTHQWLPDLASQLDIKTLFFSVFSAISTAYLTIPTRVSSQTLYDMKKPPPGFPPTSIESLKTYEARDFLYVFKSFHGGLSVYDRVTSCMKSCTAIVIKSCNEIEAPYIDFIKTQYGKPVLLASPVVPEPPTGVLDEKWSKWLDSFPSKSVIFCSFGSETFLKDEQIKELVLGLEMTDLPFFVVLNFPPGEDREVKLKSVLPEGFQERVKDKGVAHTGWVQQQLILAHDSVGCFVCHSGFSSVTEGLVNDCKLVLLPFKGDQFLNSKLVSGDMKAGVEVIRDEEEGYFGKEDLYMAVKRVMLEVNKEPGKSISANQEKWRKFLVDKEVNKRFARDFMEEMKKFMV